MIEMVSEKNVGSMGSMGSFLNKYLKSSKRTSMGLLF
jgi:hypothetical protein